jgi:hypothetical protein
MVIAILHPPFTSPLPSFDKLAGFGFALCGNFIGPRHKTAYANTAWASIHSGRGRHVYSRIDDSISRAGHLSVSTIINPEDPLPAEASSAAYRWRS